MRMLISISVLVILLSWTSISSAQNSTSTGQVSPYSHFDLFKNTKLEPCPVNSKKSLAGSVEDLAYWTGGSAKSPDDYCQYVTGTPVVIPTSPTKAAYYPSWPSFAIQVIGLMFTYLGLWMTLRKLNKDKEKRDMALPKTFWIQLPFDIARIIAWYVGFFKGLSDVSQFPWISTVIWTVPFNYIWLLLLLKKERVDYQSVADIGIKKHNLRLRIVIGVVIVVAFAQWASSLGACIIHYKYTWGGIRARMYQPLPEALANPSSMVNGTMPPKCLEFISAQGLPEEFFSSYSSLIAFISQTAQFGFTSLAAFTGIQVVMRNDYRRTYVMLRNSAAATQSALVFSALGLMGFALGALHNVGMYVTNEQSVTGPCTFIVVQMWEIWGFYDIQYGRSFRIVLNILGV